MAKQSRGPAASGLALLLAGCSLAPTYRVPATPAPAAYKEAAGWSPARPADDQARGAWWIVFGDTLLDGLEQRIEAGNPSLAAAVARRDAAQAAIGQARADLFPQAGVSANAGKSQLAGDRPQGNGRNVTYDSYVLGGSIAYELDLFGRLRNTLAATRADEAASEGDLASTRLALQASLADAYFRLRGLDEQAALLRQTVAAYSHAYDLTDTRHQGGIVSGLDVSRSQTILASARAQLSAVANARAAVEHAIAILVGDAPAGFAIAPVDTQSEPPPIPADAPSELLQRRPDIAAAERRVAAANARVGMARAALYPSLTLGLSGGFQTTDAGGALFDSTGAFWALGPLAAALPLFDGGRRRAGVTRARANFDEAAANYRATVLTGFREVEDQLAAQRELAAQEASQRAAAAAAARTEDLALSRYKDGASTYLDVVTAQTAALDAERSAISVRTQRLQAAVALVRALGGGAETGAAR